MDISGVVLADYTIALAVVVPTYENEQGLSADTSLYHEISMSDAGAERVKLVPGIGVHIKALN